MISSKYLIVIAILMTFSVHAKNKASFEVLHEALTTEERNTLDTLLLSKSNLSEYSLRTFNMDFNKLNKNKYSIELLNGEKAKLKRTKVSATIEGALLWIGEDGPTRNLKLQFANDSFFGTLRYDENLYVIEHILNDKFILYSTHSKQLLSSDITQSSLKNAHYSKAIESPIAQQMSGSSNTIRVLALYTDRAKTQYGSISISSYMTNQIENIREVFSNNGINTNFDLVGVKRTSYAEAGTFEQVHSDLELGKIHDLESMQSYYRADVVVLFADTYDYRNACASTPLNASKEQANILVIAPCTNEFMLAHEMGHLFGARHEPEEDNGGSYEHGWRNKTAKFNSIMVVGTIDNPCSDCIDIPYYTTDDQFYNGYALGNASTFNVERKIKERASIVANFDTQTTNTPDEPTLTITPWFCYGGADIYWTEEYSESNVTYKAFRSSNSNMTNPVQIYSGGNTNTSINIANQNDSPYIAVKACDNGGCSSYSNIRKVKFYSSCM